MRAIRAVWRHQCGMTLIEILIATVVLFFAVTAVLGLVAASTRINVQSAQEVATVNRVQSYVEWVRGLSWEDIGVDGTSVPGALSSASHFSDAGVEITITPTVSWVDDPRIEGENNYKVIRIVATASRGSGSRTYTYTTETFIRESDSNRPEDAVPPEIEFVSGSPGEMEAVYGTTVNVYAHAWSPMENGQLASLRFYCDRHVLRNSSEPPDYAEWTLSEADVTRSFVWDTTRLSEDGVELSPDGIRQIKIQTVDNLGQTAYRLRQVVVDNFVPETPGSLSGDGLTDVLAQLQWPYSMDGTDPSAGYRTARWKENSDGLWTYFGLEYLGNVTAHDHTATAFSRYWAYVEAVSPRGLTSGSRSVLKPYYSRSTFTAKSWMNVYSGKNAARTCATTVNLALGQPTFPYTGITNTLHRSTAPDMSGATVVGTPGAGFTFTDSYGTAVGKSGVPTPYYYQVVSTFRPTGWPDYSSSATYTVKSPIVGPVGSAETGTLAVAGW